MNFSQKIYYNDKPLILTTDSEAYLESNPVADGGLVFNEDHALLMIFRRGKWDLPKGKLDEGEDIEACSLREVCEETGLKNVTLDGKLCDSYHIYAQDGNQYLKHTSWYKMKGNITDKLKPQKEENILEARWVTEKEIGSYAARTYEAIRDVLKVAGLRW